MQIANICEYIIAIISVSLGKLITWVTCMALLQSIIDAVI